MKANYLLTIFYFFAILNLSAQCTCSSCPYFVDENNPATDQITVSGLTNPTLGAGGQDVCEIRLNIESDGIGELGIVVTSPSGNQVVLMTNTSFFSGSNYIYDISFVRCSDVALPDAGFPAIFDANAGWMSNTTYTGSYYPESGDCLEDFTGSANGTWTIDFFDNVVIDDHNILGWEIIFCDGSGTSCGPPLTCEAEGGAFHPESPIEACTGDAALNLNLTVDYQGGVPADPSLYDYSYVVTDVSGLVLDINATPDLTSYAAGSYSVCGLSYLLADASLLPSPNGSLVLSDIQDDINNDVYCADLVSTCATVIIEDNLPNPVLDWTVTDLCLGQPYTFNVTNYDPSLTYLAVINSGGFSQFSFNNGVLVIAGISGPLNICVFIEEDCDNGQTCQTFNIINGGSPPILSSLGDVCLGDDFDISVLPPNNNSSYTWTVNGPGSITQNNNDNITINANGLGVIDVCVEDTGGSCASPGQVCTQVNVIDVPAPTILADPIYCLPGGFLVGNANGSASSTVYTQVSGPGTIIFFNPNVVSTAFDVDLPGTYVIELTKTLNGCTVSTTATFDVLPELDITSSATCSNGQFTISITFNNGTGPYTVLGTQISGNTYTSPFYPSGSAVLTTFSDANGCEGDVFYQEFCSCTTDAGTMDLSPIDFCDLNGIASGIHNNDATLDSDDIGVYVLHTNANDVLGTVIDQNLTGVFSFSNPPMIAGVTYYISYVVGNDLGGSVDFSDACLSVAIGTPVTWLSPINAVASVQSDVDICDLFLTLEATNDAPSGASIIHQWSLVSGPVGETVIFSQSSSQSTDATFSAAGTYEILYQGDLNSCLFDDIIILTVEESFTLDVPTINCAADGSTYTVSFTISGGTSPILIDGQLYNGVLFESGPILNGQGYSFTVADASICPDQFVNGSFQCPCSTDAGTMSNAPIELCGLTETAFSIYNTNGFLDANDVAYFVLHDGGLNALGNIFDINTGGNFTFLAGMTAGQTYFISHVVGNPDGAFIDLNDPCLSVSFGQAVTWYEIPDLDLPIDFETCDLLVNLTATVGVNVNVEWEIIQSPLGSNPFIFNPLSTNTDIDFDLDGLYIIEVVANQNNCENIQQLEVLVLPQLSISNLSENCEGSTYTVSFDILGGVGTYAVNGNVIAGNSYESDPIASGTPYNFSVSDENNCLFEGIQGVRNCDCITDSGTMSDDLIQGCDTSVIIADIVNNETLDANDLGLYYLHTGSQSALGNILAINSTPSFTRPATVISGTIYYISYVAGDLLNPNEIDLNDPCLDVSVGQPIVWYDSPIIDFFDSLLVCNDTLELNLTQSALELANVASNQLGLPFTIVDSIIYIEVVDIIDTLITFEVEENTCIAKDSVQVVNRGRIFIQNEVLCNENRDAYDIELTISGGFPPYLVNGDTLIGNRYVENNISITDTSVFIVEDALLCSSETLSIVANCECNPSIHLMSGELIATCDTSEILVGTLLNEGPLGSNDVGVFVLHDRSDDTLGTILAIDSMGAFAFTSNLVFDTEYYISYISGDSTSNGSINFSDPCLSISFGQPILFYSTPQLPSFMDSLSCFNELEQPRYSNGDEIIYRGIGSNANDLEISIDQDDNVLLRFTQNGAYFIERKLGDSCIVKDTIKVSYLDSLQVLSLERTCSGDNQSYSITFEIRGGQEPYFVNGEELVGNQFSESGIFNLNDYSYLIVSQGLCDSILVEGSFDCSCPSLPAALNNIQYVLCEGEDFEIELIQNADLNQGFMEAYILHDGTPLEIGTIIASYSSSQIAYQTSIPLNQELLITPIVGPNVNGMLDIEDDCALLGNSVEVIWRSLQTLSINAPSSVCIEEDSFNIDLSLASFTYPLNILLVINGAEIIVEVTDEQLVSIPISNFQDDLDIQFTIEDGTCINPNNPTNIEVIVEQCECDQNEFNFPNTLCSNIGSINLKDWIISGPDGNWDISFASNSALVELADSLLDIDISYEGDLILSFDPIGGGACDTTYLLNLEVEPFVDLSLTQSTETVCLDEAGQIDLNDLLLGQWSGQGAWSSRNNLSDQILSNGMLNADQLNPGVYLFDFSVEGLTVCSFDTLTFTLIIPERPEYIITSNNPLCFGDMGSLSISFTEPSSIAEVLINGSPLAGIDISDLQPGLYDIVISDVDLCQYVEQVIIEDAEALDINLSGQVIINEGQNAVINAQVEGGTEPYEYEWVVDGGLLNGVNEDQLSLNINEDIEVQLTVIDANGCTVEDLIILRLIEEDTPIVLPNVISAASNVNNLFTIPSNNSISKVNSLSIFDRWGNLVFNRTDVDPNSEVLSWDGSKNGEEVVQGVYIYLLDYENERGDIIQKYGDITVVR